MTDAIRDTGLGDRRRFPWKGRWHPFVESVAIFVWCRPILTLGETTGVFLIGFGIGRGWA